ncbi:MAG: M48 family metallopeptidase [Gemmatimonadota bacterium]|nr:M48 family metallopeptidase [Gemmatimonadota bacterium]
MRPERLSPKERAHLVRLVACWSKRLRVTPRVVRVQQMRRKWGSCSTGGTITLASELVRQTSRFQNFVVAHELLHMRIPNHSKLFKAMLSAHVPGWRHHAARLKRGDRRLTPERRTIKS